MNIIVAVKDYTELDRIVRPLVAAGHQVTPVTKPGTLLRTLGALKADLVLLDWGFGGGDEQLVKSVRGPDPSGPRVVLMIPDRWPVEAAHAFAWGVDDLVRRPICMPEVVMRIERIGAAAGAIPDVERGAPAEWSDLAFWRDLEDIVTADLGATIGVSLTRAPADASRPLTVTGLSRLLLTAEGIEVVIGVGVDGGSDGALAALVLGGPATPDGLADVVSELTNVAAGAIKRAALDAGKVFALGLPQLYADGARTVPLERRWCARGDNGIEVQCIASARSSKPEVVACGHLREGMVVNSNVLGPTGMLLAAQGTCLTDRSVERLRSMLGDRYAIEVTLPIRA